MGPTSAAASWQHTLDCMRGDACRRGVPATTAAAIRLAASNRSMRYQVVLRLVHHLHAHRPRSLRHLALRALHQRMTVRYGYEFPVRTEIGPGLLIRHLGPIVVHSETVIGRNVNLNTGVVIGRAARGPRAGVPRIGNNVYVGPGAKVIGGIVIGDDVSIGANAVVTRDVADHQVVAGVPARVISDEGSAGYVEHPC